MQGRPLMSYLIKGVVAAAMLAGGLFAVSEPAQARIGVSVGIGVPVYGPRYNPYCDRYSRWFDPYRCDAAYYDDDYDGPVFIDGFWFDGHHRHRRHHGHHQFWFHNNWHDGHMGHHRHHHH